MGEQYRWDIIGGWGGSYQYTRPGYGHFIVRRVDSDPDRFELVDERNSTTSRLSFSDLYSALDEALDLVEAQVVDD
ncbi:hypothetical protein [Dactylosporangium salmoneum]|uniref:Uncharacterized protein n=1 Tax=Dactylosporangium salmoneum TaxID=53361 RepID=A0ABN3GBJ1_9ACTN